MKLTISVSIAPTEVDNSINDRLRQVYSVGELVIIAADEALSHADEYARRLAESVRRDYCTKRGIAD